jgi:hypothetical protein
MSDIGISLEQFKSNITDLARPNRFEVAIDDTEWQAEFGYLVKACSLPSKEIGEILLNWNGMVYKIPGDITFADFSITFLNDIDFKIKNYFEAWLSMIGEQVTNTRGVHSDVKCDMTISQLNGLGNVVKTYNMIGCHPKTMDAIDLDHDSTDGVEHLVITFAYSYFTTGNAATAGMTSSSVNSTPAKPTSNDLAFYQTPINFNNNTPVN